MDTLVFATISSVATGGLYAFIGARLARRQVPRDARLAHTLFVVWWLGLAATSLAGAAILGLYQAGLLSVWLYETVSQASILFLLVALWGLLYYLVYVYTGSKRAVVPLAAFYAVFFLYFQALLAWIGAPEAITDNGWNIIRDPEPELPAWMGYSFVLLLIGPQFIACVLYLALLRKAEGRTQRYRILMVGGAIFVWFGTSIIATFAGAGTGMAWQLGSRLLSIAASLAILLAYFPPPWVQRRLQVDGVRPDAAVPATPSFK